MRVWALHDNPAEHYTYSVSRSIGGQALPEQFEFDKDRPPPAWFSFDLYNYIMDNRKVTSIVIMCENGSSMTIKRKEAT